jgi:hypothetical protein
MTMTTITLVVRSIRYLLASLTSVAFGTLIVAN